MNTLEELGRTGRSRKGEDAFFSRAQYHTTQKLW